MTAEMSVEMIPLEYVQANPFQTRDGEDQEHIKKLAMSIAEVGLLQIPTGRLVGDDTCPLVQLAFGHSRLAAYRFLHDAGTPGFDRFPINLKVISDDQMFELAVTENLERKDLSPIEEAKAMARYRDEFHKSSEEVGKLFHLSDSTVRNKMRLLGLPDEIQEGLRERKISEGAARELLTWLDIPEEFRKKNFQCLRWKFGAVNEKTDPIVQSAADGSNAEKIHGMINDVISRGDPLSKAPWKKDEELQGEKIVGVCKGCAQRFDRDGKAVCTNEECYKAKQHTWQRQYLKQASLLSGIQVLEEEKDHGSYYSLSEFSSWQGDHLRTLEKSVKAHCENLRLVFDEHDLHSDHQDDIHLVKIGFPKAKIICGKRSGSCTCLKAYQKGMDIQPGENGKLDSETLKEIDRERRGQERLNSQFVDSMESKTAAQIFAAMISGDVKVWWKIAARFDFALGSELSEKENLSFEMIQQGMAKKLAAANRYNNDPQAMLAEFNRLLANLGLDLLPWEIDPKKPNGKTLNEVFAAEEKNNA